MNLERFIASRIYKNRDDERRISKPAVWIAMCGTAVGLAVMIVSLCIVIGFKHEIRSKVIGFGAHIQIQNINSSQSYEVLPITIGNSLMTQLDTITQVEKVQRFSTKPGIVNTDDAFQGIMLKGVAEEYDLSFFKQYLCEGVIPCFSDSLASDSVLLSQALARKLNLKLGDKISTFFIQNNIRARRLTIAGIFSTDFADFDNLILMTDLYTVNRLNEWGEDDVTGLELLISDYDRLEEVTDEVATFMASQHERYGGSYYTQSIEELNPNLFAWLNILDTNVWLILILILGVAGFTMISGLLILILERASMIGILKALGAPNVSIRKVFLYLSLFIIGRGMFWGNVIGLSLCWIQQQFGIVKLDAAMYSLDRVPIEFNIPLIILLNVGMLLISMLMLVAPSHLISRISPVKTIRFE